MAHYSIDDVATLFTSILNEKDAKTFIDRFTTLVYDRDQAIMDTIHREVSICKRARKTITRRTIEGVLGNVLGDKYQKDITRHSELKKEITKFLAKTNPGLSASDERKFQVWRKAKKTAQSGLPRVREELDERPLDEEDRDTPSVTNS